MADGSRIYRFGEFRLDSDVKVLMRGNEPVHLPLKATEILLTLLEHCDEVVTKEQLMSAVWPDKVVDEANLKQNIAVIRKTLAVAPGIPGHIDTFVGRGYRIIGSITAEPPDAPAASPPPSPVFSSRAAIAILAVCGLLGPAFIYWQSRNRLVSTPSTVSRITPVTRLLGAESQPQVSPDGHKVAFLWQQTGGKPPGIWVKSIDAGDPVRIGLREGRHSSPAWSPDGKSVAYLWIGIDRTEILVADSDGSGERVLAQFPLSSYIFRQRLLDWSPDGKWLCLSHSNDPKGGSTLSLIDAQTGQQRHLTGSEPEAGSDVAPRFSPDGSMISYIRHIGRTDQELRVAPFRGGGHRRIFSDGKLIVGQDWDAHGKSIVFASNRTGEFRLWRIPVQGASAEPRPLELFSEFPIDISIARHSSLLIYSVETEDRDIWRLDLQDKRWDRVIASSAQDASPQYSPDGSRICFRSNRSGEDQLWLADANGEHPVQLTTGTLHPNFGHWSPDGRSIVFNDHTAAINIAEWRDNKWNIRGLGISGSHPVFSKDGKWIYAGRPSGLARIPSSGGEPTTIANVRAFSLAVSPDGESIYFAGENGAELWRVPARGGTASKVLDVLLPGCTSCWALAPNGIYYLRGKNSLDEQFLYFRDFSTQKDIEVMPYPEPLVPMGSGPFSLSPDYRYLACVRTQLPGGDLMKIEPFR